MLPINPVVSSDSRDGVMVVHSHFVALRETLMWKNKAGDSTFVKLYL